MFLIMEETIIFLDGYCLSFISKFLGKGKPPRYKIEDFASRIATETTMICGEIYYYAVPPHVQNKI